MLVFLGGSAVREVCPEVPGGLGYSLVASGWDEGRRSPWLPQIEAKSCGFGLFCLETCIFVTFTLL